MHARRQHTSRYLIQLTDSTGRFKQHLSFAGFDSIFYNTGENIFELSVTKALLLFIFCGC